DLDHEAAPRSTPSTTLLRELVNPFPWPASVLDYYASPNGVNFRIAEGLYAERAFDRLPILADGCEEAGCTDARFLAHLRGPGPPALGCRAWDCIFEQHWSPPPRRQILLPPAAVSRYDE